MDKILASLNLDEVKEYIEFLEADNKRLHRQVDNAYEERNQCVAVLAAILPSVLTLDIDSDFDHDWRNVVHIRVDGQRPIWSWHLHDSHLDFFTHVARDNNAQWDGTTTEQKYADMAAWCLEER